MTLIIIDPVTKVQFLGNVPQTVTHRILKSSIEADPFLGAIFLFTSFIHFFIWRVYSLQLYLHAATSFWCKLFSQFRNPVYHGKHLIEVIKDTLKWSPILLGQQSKSLTSNHLFVKQMPLLKNCEALKAIIG